MVGCEGLLPEWLVDGGAIYWVGQREGSEEHYWSWRKKREKLIVWGPVQFLSFLRNVQNEISI